MLLLKKCFSKKKCQTNLLNVKTNWMWLSCVGVRSNFDFSKICYNLEIRFLSKHLRSFGHWFWWKVLNIRFTLRQKTTFANWIGYSFPSVLPFFSEGFFCYWEVAILTVEVFQGSRGWSDFGGVNFPTEIGLIANFWNLKDPIGISELSRMNCSL